MKVGTDSVLLGAWADVVSGSRVLDVGAGCGLLSLMAAQRGAGSVTAIEIDDAAAGCCRDNCSRSPWAGQIEVVTADIRDIVSSLGSFDLVISNPPFFSETLKAPDSRRALARHGDGFDVLDLIGIAPSLLKPDGRLAFIAPYSRRDDIVMSLAMARLDASRMALMRQRPSRPVTRLLVEAVAAPAAGIVEQNEICINNSDGAKTDAYWRLTSPFYIH